MFHWRPQVICLPQIQQKKSIYWEKKITNFSCCFQVLQLCMCGGGYQCHIPLIWKESIIDQFQSILPLKLYVNFSSQRNSPWCSYFPWQLLEVSQVLASIDRKIVWENQALIFFVRERAGNWYLWVHCWHVNPVLLIWLHTQKQKQDVVASRP